MRERRPATAADPVKEFEDYEHFESSGSIPEGRFVVPYNGVPVDFVYHPIENARTTVVFFHGSTQKTVSLPMHSGVGIMRNIPANRLAISDPSLTLDGSCELILSWFIGSSQQPRLQFFLEMIIRRIRELTGDPHMIFMGGSGGGFASLEMSRRFPDSLALVMNPQTSLSNYYPNLVQKYLECCWPGTDSLDELPRFVTHNITDSYSSVLNHTVAFVQNTRDKFHLENHQLPFFGKVGRSRKVFMLMDAWGDPTKKAHVAPPTTLMRRVLLNLVEAKGGWRSSLVASGFDHHTTEVTVRRAVKKANTGLPEQLEADVM